LLLRNEARSKADFGLPLGKLIGKDESENDMGTDSDDVSWEACVELEGTLLK
jgi:hypothetical protein